MDREKYWIINYQIRELPTFNRMIKDREIEYMIYRYPIDMEDLFNR
jgi:hypothetical protein